MEMHSTSRAVVEREPSLGKISASTMIKVRQRFEASSEAVFAAWLDPRIAGRWLFATASRPMTQVDIDARVGGAFRLMERGNGRLAEYVGKYLQIAPPRRLAFTLFLDNRSHIATRVTVTIEAQRRGCELSLRHENLPPECARYAEARWTGILYGLGVTL
jgi:uncharacterized protein YndB with AHSA1/START domain